MNKTDFDYLSQDLLRHISRASDDWARENNLEQASYPDFFPPLVIAFVNYISGMFNVAFPDPKEYQKSCLLFYNQLLQCYKKNEDDHGL